MCACKAREGLRCFWVAWLLLTWFSTAVCFAGLLLPYWLRGMIPMHRGIQSDLGIFRRCIYPVYNSRGDVVIQHGCGHYAFGDIPHFNWKIALCLLGGAVCIQFFLTFFLTFVGFCLHIMARRTVYRTCQIAQLVSGCLTVSACLLYPFGWKSNSEVEQICGDFVSPFMPSQTGRCHIGWGYVLTCAGAFLTLITTALPLMLETGCMQQQADHIILATDSLGVPGPASLGLHTPSHRAPSTAGARSRYSYVSYQSLTGTTTLRSDLSPPHDCRCNAGPTLLLVSDRRSSIASSQPC